MGKNKRTIPEGDTYARMNFLYQAAHQCFKMGNVTQCRFYIYTLRTIAKRGTLHLHPNIKRTVCKRCCILLMPGITASVRTRSKRQKHTVVTCLECGTLKRYVYKPGHLPLSDQPDLWTDQVVNGQVVSQPKGRKTQQQGTVKPATASSQAVSAAGDSAVTLTSGNDTGTTKRN